MGDYGWSLVRSASDGSVGIARRRGGAEGGAYLRPESPSKLSVDESRRSLSTSRAHASLQEKNIALAFRCRGGPARLGSSVAIYRSQRFAEDW